MELLENQEIEEKNLLSIRKNVTQQEIEQVLTEMHSYIKESGAEIVGKTITATHGISSNKGYTILDLEILIPLDKEILTGNIYSFKKNFKITNAIKVTHKGNPALLDETCNELNQYIARNKLVPITVGYNMTLTADNKDKNNTEIEIYVGISPNIL
ncbi:AraC family transcriptional regulator [Anaerosporobacter sp.]|uniref:AraC family transcriptional regulator n=1 Tax=Anaerosporobacter sp. TaxID=1872529 RepID=UPI00286F805F|nr:AraC family transcriptional regulator [Anaerosporobacter sp.]